jgi:RNA polymerase sigma-70 factor (ECF subfamily)
MMTQDEGRDEEREEERNERGEHDERGEDAREEPREDAGRRSSSGPEPEDLLLVGRFLQHRDERSFRALYRMHSPALMRLTSRVVRGDRQDAEEVLQATWIRAVEKLPSFRWESSLRTWLAGIALNCARELLRQRRRQPAADPIDLEGGAALPPIAPHVRPRDLEEAIATLPDGYREVLVLHDIEGYTHIEIGRLLGIQSGTSKSQLLRARRAVRARLLQLGNLGHA